MAKPTNLAAVDDNTAPPAEPAKRGRKPAQPVPQINMTETPIFLLMWQTPTAYRFEHVEGDAGAEDRGRAKAIEFAKKKAVELKTKVIISGPQFGAFEPPDTSAAREAPVAFG
jgi:hypothetical protein